MIKELRKQLEQRGLYPGWIDSIIDTVTENLNEDHYDFEKDLSGIIKARLRHIKIAIEKTLQESIKG